MKAWLLLASLAVAAQATTIIPTHSHVRQTDEEWKDKQTKVIELLSWGKMEEAYENEYYDWDIEHHAESFTNQEVFHHFLKELKEGFTSRETTYTMHDPEVRNQTITLFELFYYAKDFDTFYKTASWARKHVNFINFAYAFSVAIYNRPDCKGLEIPPTYEVIPNYFVHSHYMHKAYKAKMNDQHNWRMHLNYTGYEEYYHKGAYGGVLKQWPQGQKYEENRLTYFREDVVLNDFYSRWFLHWPTWFNTEEHHVPKWHHRGELFYYMHQQLLARYILERYANNLPSVDFLEWDKPIKTGYNPNLYSWKGLPLFTRPDYYNIEDHHPSGVWLVKDMERKFIDAIDSQVIYEDDHHGFITIRERDGTDLFGRIVAHIPQGVSKTYYGNYFISALKTLAYSVKTHTDKHFVGGATGYMMTALRDPAYYQFLHRMIKFFQAYKSHLPHYTPKELEYEGVKIDSFEVDKIITYFEDFEFDITQGLGMGKGEHKEDYHYVASQPRINHKPFTYKLTVSSDKTEDAMVRIFIGPKYDSNGVEFSIEQARMAYFELDRFPVKLTSGQNIIERSSRDSTVFVKDFTTIRTFKEYVTKYTKSYPNYNEGPHCGFPEHFQVPKGKKSGMTYVMYAIVTPYDHKYTSEHEEKHFDAFVTCGGSKFYDYKPYGYPFDRVIPYEDEFYTHNMYFKDIQVYHKDDQDYAFVSDGHRTRSALTA